MSTLLRRSLTGLVFVLVLVAAIYLHRLSLITLFFILSVLAQEEFRKLSKSEFNLTSIVNALLGSGIYIVSILVYFGIAPVLSLSIPAIILMIRVLLALFIQGQSSVNKLASSLYGVFYCTLPFLFLTFIAFPSRNPESFEPMRVLQIFILIWIYDSFAYLSGVQFGKHRLYERISPKKSWEGFFGGALVTFAIALIPFSFLPDYGIVNRLIIAGLIIIFGTLGDLFESMLKREAGVKDSGSILPGHGGILDRFDSILFIAPVLWLYLQTF